MAAGQMAADILGAQRSLVDYVTLVNSTKMPAVAMLEKGPTVDNLNYEWPVDMFDDGADNAVVDAKDVDSFDNAAEKYAVLNNRIQWMRKTALVSKLAQNVQNQAGVKDKKAYAVRKKLDALWRDIEAAICSDNEMVVGTNTTANKLRGLGAWIQSTAQGVNPVPADYLTPAGSIHTGTIAALTESVVQGLLQSLWTNNDNEVKTYTLLCGPTLKRAFTDFTALSAGSTNVMSSVKVYNQDMKSRQIVAAVDKFVGDFGALELVPTTHNAKFTSDAASLRRGYILDTAKVDLVWKQMPQVQNLEDKGGGPRFYIDCIVGMRVYNPKSLGKISSTS